MDYDFAELNDKEFEVLVVDLLSAELKTHVERFKPGKDTGVDGRFFISGNREVIVQCKHYVKSGYGKLVRHLKRSEVQKVAKLRPARYILATSIPLSRANKQEVAKLFSPYMVREDDVIGNEDLNSFLAKYPEVEEKHYKLWIASSAVLQNLLNGAIKGRSRHELVDIRRNVSWYVRTGDYAGAMEGLEAARVLIISGEPGIGKTTLARNLALTYAGKGFEFVDIEESVSEAEAVYRQSKKQFFYFDDFLGSNYFEAIENKKDSHIANFIKRVARDPSKRFVLTSRTNILNAGFACSPIFGNSNLRSKEYLLRISSLSPMDRAKILYNHMWFSRIEESCIDQLYKDRRYRTVIFHRNYNPRVIEFVLDADRVMLEDKSSYWDYVVRMLENPREIWSHAFKVQSDEHVRGLTKITVYNGGRITEGSLRKAFARYALLSNVESKSNVEKDFTTVAKAATRSFLNREKDGQQVHYSLFNPSIADFVLFEYSQDEAGLLAAFKSLESVLSLRQLKAMLDSGFIDGKTYQRVIRALLADLGAAKKPPDYVIWLVTALKDDDECRNDIVARLQGVIDKPQAVSNISGFIELALEFSVDLKFGDFGFLTALAGANIWDEDDIRAFARFAERFAISSKGVLETLRAEFEYFLIDSVGGRIGEIDFSQYVHVSWEADGEDISVDRTDLENKIYEMLLEVAGQFEVACISDLEWNAEACLAAIDVDDAVNDYVKALQEEDYERDGWGGTLEGSSIDDLFDRS